MSSFRKIFVVGCPRSGTSWISKLIGEHKDALDCGTESHAFPFVMDPICELPPSSFRSRLQSFRQLTKESGWGAVFKGPSEETAWQSVLHSYDEFQGRNVGLHHFITKDELTDILNQARQRTTSEPLDAKGEFVVTRIFETFWEKRRNSETVFVEKTPLHIRYVPRILKMYPEATIVDVIRDGRDTDASRAALAKNPEKAWAKASTEEKIQLWIECIQLSKIYNDDPSIASRYHQVRYEDMRAEPDSTLAELLQFCDLPTSDEERAGILSRHDINLVKGRGTGHFVRSGTIGSWQSELTPEAIQLWQERAGDLLEGMGYTLPASE